MASKKEKEKEEEEEEKDIYLYINFFFFTFFCFFFFVFLRVRFFLGALNLLWRTRVRDVAQLLLINSTVYLSGNRDIKFRRESKLAFSNPIIIDPSLNYLECLCFFFLIFWFSGLGGDLIWVISLFPIWVLLILMIEEVKGHFEISHLSFSLSLSLSLA